MIRKRIEELNARIHNIYLNRLDDKSALNYIQEVEEIENEIYLLNRLLYSEPDRLARRSDISEDKEILVPHMLRVFNAENEAFMRDIEIVSNDHSQLSKEYLDLDDRGRRVAMLRTICALADGGGSMIVKKRI